MSYPCLTSLNPESEDYSKIESHDPLSKRLHRRLEEEARLLAEAAALLQGGGLFEEVWVCLGFRAYRV